MDDPEHFFGTDSEGRKVSFKTTVNPLHARPKIQSLRYTRHIDPIHPSERVGPKWGPA